MEALEDDLSAESIELEVLVEEGLKLGEMGEGRLEKPETKTAFNRADSSFKELLNSRRVKKTRTEGILLGGMEDP